MPDAVQKRRVRLHIHHPLAHEIRRDQLSHILRAGRQSRRVVAIQRNPPHALIRLDAHHHVIPRRDPLHRIPRRHQSHTKRHLPRLHNAHVRNRQIVQVSHQSSQKHTSCELRVTSGRRPTKDVAGAELATLNSSLLTRQILPIRIHHHLDLLLCLQRLKRLAPLVHRDVARHDRLQLDLAHAP